MTARVSGGHASGACCREGRARAGSGCVAAQDVACPLAIDERWEDDTLFLIFQEHFRFDPGEAERVRPSEAARPADGGDEGEEEERRCSDGGARPARAGTWWEVPKKARAGAYASIPENVTDLVRIATAAHRCGRGNLIWAGWQPAGAGIACGKPEVRGTYGSKGDYGACPAPIEPTAMRACPAPVSGLGSAASPRAC